MGLPSAAGVEAAFEATPSEGAKATKAGAEAACLVQGNNLPILVGKRVVGWIEPRQHVIAQRFGLALPTLVGPGEDVDTMLKRVRQEPGMQPVRAVFIARSDLRLLPRAARLLAHGNNGYQG